MRPVVARSFGGARLHAGGTNYSGCRTKRSRDGSLADGTPFGIEG